MSGMDLFDFPKVRIEKKIRLIELFAGIGAQAMALRDIGADFEHYKVIEFCGHFGKIKYDVFRYLEKCGLDDYNGVELYRDYWRLLKQTTHSKTESYWRFPKNLAKKHNELLKEVEHLNLIKEAEKLKDKQERYFKSVKKLLKYKMNIDG